LFRGFALADRIAPFVVVNDHDSAAAWAFTLLHEMVHICLGDTGISSARGEGAIERFCNDAASVFLLTDQELAVLGVRGKTPVPTALELIGEFARPLNLSHTMVAYRLMRTGAISQDYWRQLHTEYRRFWFEAQAQRRARARRTEGGPSYYVVRRHRIGEALLEFVRRMLGSGALSTVRAAKVLAVKPQNVGALLSNATPETEQAA
jgi:Zn-dependent peptidase ImmA (M78 family)